MDEIFAKINSEINIKRYKREYMSHFEVLRDAIFTALKKNQTFTALYNGNYLRGSYADNLKVKYPNEYDVVFRLKLPEEKRILVVKDKKIPGNVKLDLSQLFTDLDNSLEKCKLPFYWDPNLNLYDQIRGSGLTDMRRCVQSKKKLLENYARLKVRTEVDHFKVYKTFLTVTELKENGLIKSSAIPKDKSPEKIELISAEPRTCIIL
ncbi:PREDICTED: uncharacterized protein LOC108969737 [Bactrocera latifrons]|uniref:Mab-21-like nucleotidyltransferase domain-containing protein n=1 Tax=Bactrocera latifrons TaxID=174628 RepID=A0A0K8U2J9_BACLA|nr:PREDICTED: uncharacterized protein LOC108969737 [Bactrocera latifrons]